MQSAARRNTVYGVATTSRSHPWRNSQLATRNAQRAQRRHRELPPAVARTRLVILLAFLTLMSTAAPAADADGRVLPAGANVTISAESPEIVELPAAAQDLLLRSHGAEASVFDGRVAAFHSAPLTRGATALEAEQAFWAENADAFGISNLNLTLVRSHDVADRKFTVFAYTQRIDGLPVENSSARVLVRNGPECAVVYAAGKFVPPPKRPFDPIAISPKDLSSRVRSGGEYSGLDAWGPPELVVYAGEEPRWREGPGRFGDAVRAWRFAGVKTSPGGAAEAYTFYVDASSGDLLDVRSDVHDFDVTGRVSANATLVVPSGNPGEWWNWSRPDSGSNYGLVDMPEIRVRIEGTTAEAFTDADGEFTIPYEGTGDIQLRVDLLGPWFNVNNLEDQGSDYSLLTPFGSPASPWVVELNPSGAPFVTAQGNGFASASEMRRLFLANTTWTGLNQRLTVEVNVSDAECNAFFYSTGRLRFDGPPDCPVNTAFSSVVSHEYGHFIAHQLGLAQGAFGEGFGDACAVLLTDDPWFGRGPDDSNPSAGRNYEPGEIEYPYPCPTGIGQLCEGSESHCCGRILGGRWWDIREWFHDGAGEPGDFEDALAARAYAQKLFVAWALMTQGGSGTASAHPLTGIEILTMDDDDGNLTNGTPHSDDIEKALDAHQIPLTPGTNPPPVVSFQPRLNRKSSPDPDDPNVVGIDPFAIAAGDLNNDSIQDVVLTCEGSANVLVYLGASATPTTYTVQAGQAFSVGTTGSRPAKVVLAHMKVDGDPVDNLLDIVVTLQGQNAVQVLKNLGGGQFGQGLIIDFNTAPARVVNPVGLVVDDFDGSGLNDIAIAGYVESPTGQNPGRTEPVLGLAWTNADASRRRESAQVTLLPEQSSRGLGLCACASLFIPGYGTSQLAMSSQSTAQVFIFNYRQTPAPPTFVLAMSGPVTAVPSPGICAADFNSDHKVDLTCSSPGVTAQVRWVRQLSSAVYELQDDPTTITRQPFAVAVGKISKKGALPITLDQRIDVVVGRAGNDDTRLQVLANRGILTDLFSAFEFAVSPIITDVPNPRGVAVWDMNADGFPDVLTANAGSALPGDDGTDGFSVLLNKTQ